MHQACRIFGIAVLAASVLMAAGCSGGAQGGGSDAAQVQVKERDFRIASPDRVPAGKVKFAVDNHGPDAHELIVVRQGQGNLPFRADGITVDEDALKAEIAGALEPEAKSKRELSVDLTPGRYELICNMAGHYRGGMHRKFVVS
jgi:hypothetical protein